MTTEATLQLRRRLKRFFACLFFTYLTLLLYVTLFTYNYYVYGKSINLEFFDSIQLMLDSGNLWLIIKNVIGNVILFMPFGFFAPLLIKKLRPFLLSFLVSIGASFIIEVFQYTYAKRIFDVDDILLNVIGAITGWLIFRLAHGLYRLVLRLLHK